ncbi:MAG: hypothetical protein LBQ14_08390 [Treponema sp.]|jgi:hypothetical protein|nr:hypothetical protein [Treponema sp.]
MKKERGNYVFGHKLFVIIMIFALALISHATAQPEVSDSVTTMGLSGATSIYGLPTARVSWPGQNFGFNVGYHFTAADPDWDNDDDVKMAHNIGANFGFLKWVEASVVFDFQPEYWTAGGGDNNDLLIGAKVQLPFKNASYPAVAVGGNIQFLNMGGDNGGANKQNEYAGTTQFYAAITYAASFFGAPLETTAVLGKTFVIDSNDRQADRDKIGKTNIDFGMGLDMTIFPNTFQHFVHWLAEYSNFSYSNDSLGADYSVRGVMNTGVRVDLSRIPALDKFNAAIDVMGTDLLDHKQRGFSLGFVFGMPVL